MLKRRDLCPLSESVGIFHRSLKKLIFVVLCNNRICTIVQFTYLYYNITYIKENYKVTILRLNK